MDQTLRGSRSASAPFPSVVADQTFGGGWIIRVPVEQNICNGTKSTSDNDINDGSKDDKVNNIF
jgi:hypothetical protein